MIQRLRESLKIPQTLNDADGQRSKHDLLSLHFVETKVCAEQNL
jgi:hypothetical protein